MKLEFLRRLYDPRYLAGKMSDPAGIPDAKTIYGNTFRMAWPAIAESFLVALVGIADTAMVSRLGPAAISAVSITIQPKMLILCFFLALNVAVTAIVARRKGEQRQEEAQKTLTQGIVVAVGMMFIFVSLALCFSKPLLVFAGAQTTGPDAYIQEADIYFRIILYTLPFSILTLLLNAAQRGAGNTRISMVTNMTANLINVIFNYFLIYGKCGFPRMEVTGAAIATGIGTVAGFIIAVISALKKDNFVRLSLHTSWKTDVETLRLFAGIGGAAMVEQVFLRIGFFIYVKLVASLGTTDYATHQICMQMLSLSFNFGDGIAIASTSLVGQSLGAKRPTLAMVYGKACQRLALIAAFIIVIAFTAFGKPILWIFTDDPEIISRGLNLFLIAAASAPFQVSQVVYNGSLRGSGDTRFVAFTSFISVAVVRPVLTYLFIYTFGMGLYGAWYALFIDQFTRYMCSYLRYSGGKWMAIRI